MSETFAERLRRLRRERGYSVSKLARAIDTSEGLIRQLESGTTRSPAFQTGLRIALVLDVDPYLLAYGVERQDLLE